MRRDPEVDLLGGGASDARAFGSQIERGTVGFAQDRTDADCLEAGDGGTGEAGITLLHVTLYTGRGLNQRPKPGVAQGREVLVQLGWPVTVPPPRGMQCICAFPGGDLSPGNGVLLQCIAPASKTQFAAGRGILDVGPDMRLTLKGQNVTLMDHGRDEGRFPCFLAVGPAVPGESNPGITVQDPTGSGLRIANGIVGAVATDGGSPPALKASLELSAAQFVLALNGVGFVRCDSSSGNLTVGCSGVAYLTGKQCMIGAQPTLLTPAVVGPSGMSGAASTCVFISP